MRHTALPCFTLLAVGFVFATNNAMGLEGVVDIADGTCTSFI